MINIRPAKTGDETGIARVHVASWQFSYRDIFSAELLAVMSVNDRAAMWSERITNIQNQDTKIGIFVAEIDSDIKGFASLSASTVDNADPSEGEVTAVYIYPDYQGQGIGQLLLKEVFAELSRRGFKTAFVRTLEKSPYKHFYAKQGGVLQDKIFTRTFQDGKVRNIVEYRWDL